ncbi:dihydropteroate synthase [Geobacillus sp. G4]|uniref:Dihydropteroate synthase n=6 Tax=Geobacillus TaxID=129337 RepID=Q5L3S4_GEOKA|nr:MULTISPECIES: dihydropteroate synthase [Geobacillus]ALA70455.1 dihydropteroate synthase [Geobacillus stearothermophilus 10]ADI25142.1 dihydropteroate synthase [Geobacillus sp. C56-T3]ADU92584.1 dihydropteroate synthase [Geobacillus sp. Y412MC52]AEV17409.1 Dihydropteroate synthase [Geobacillus thermoleovorans CCB_US3_UF5]AMV09462.1 dihydropteroate synthase [Geobacillus thermoleovorans]
MTTSMRPLRLQCRGHELDLNKKTLIMGIVNVTPDSFSDGGRFYDVENAVKHAKRLVAEGADIIDIGGESTRPGADPVPLDEELRRVIPAVKAIAKAVSVPISIDTYKAEVARQAMEAGAHIINDVWGAKADPDMARVAATYGAPIILMHNRRDMAYRDLISDMIADLKESIRIVKEAGVKDENIILDPGIGFAKTVEHNLEVMRRLDEFAALGYPLLLGTSRKRFIGHVLGVPVEERVEGTGATVCLGIMKGVHIVRVHDVLPIARMAKMMDAMLGKGESGHR